MYEPCCTDVPRALGPAIGEIDLKKYPNYKENLKQSVAGEFANVNAVADDLRSGLRELDRLIRHHIGKLPIAKKDIEPVQCIISDFLPKWPPFLNEIDQVVEVWGLIWAYRPDGKLAWSLKVIWGR